MNCCKNIICAGTFNKCQDIILLPITALISGSYSVHYQYAGGMLNGQSSFYNASEPIKFNNIIYSTLLIFHEYYVHTSQMHDP